MFRQTAQYFHTPTLLPYTGILTVFMKYKFNFSKDKDQIERTNRLYTNGRTFLLLMYDIVLEPYCIHPCGTIERNQTNQTHRDKRRVRFMTET